MNEFIRKKKAKQKEEKKSNVHVKEVIVSVWVLLFLLPHCDFQTASYNITNNTEPGNR